MGRLDGGRGHCFKNKSASHFIAAFCVPISHHVIGQDLLWLRAHHLDIDSAWDVGHRWISLAQGHSSECYASAGCEKGSW